MEPVSLGVGIAGAISASISIGTALKKVTHQYRDAPESYTFTTKQCAAVSGQLALLQSLMLNETWSKQLGGDGDTSDYFVTIVMNCAENLQELEACVGTIRLGLLDASGQGMTVKQRAKIVWKDDEIQTHLTRLSTSKDDIGRVLTILQAESMVRMENQMTQLRASMETLSRSRTTKYRVVRMHGGGIDSKDSAVVVVPSSYPGAPKKVAGSGVSLADVDLTSVVLTTSVDERPAIIRIANTGKMQRAESIRSVVPTGMFGGQMKAFIGMIEQDRADLQQKVAEAQRETEKALGKISEFESTHVDLATARKMEEENQALKKEIEIQRRQNDVEAKRTEEIWARALQVVKDAREKHAVELDKIQKSLVKKYEVVLEEKHMESLALKRDLRSSENEKRNMKREHDTNMQENHKMHEHERRTRIAQMEKAIVAVEEKLQNEVANLERHNKQISEECEVRINKTRASLLRQQEVLQKKKEEMRRMELEFERVIQDLQDQIVACVIKHKEETEIRATEHKKELNDWKEQLESNSNKYEEAIRVQEQDYAIRTDHLRRVSSTLTETTRQLSNSKEKNQKLTAALKSAQIALAKSHNRRDRMLTHAEERVRHLYKQIAQAHSEAMDAVNEFENRSRQPEIEESRVIGILLTELEVKENAEGETAQPNSEIPQNSQQKNAATSSPSHSPQDSASFTRENSSIGNLPEGGGGDDVRDDVMNITLCEDDRDVKLQPGDRGYIQERAEPGTERPLDNATVEVPDYLIHGGPNQGQSLQPPTPPHSPEACKEEPAKEPAAEPPQKKMAKNRKGSFSPLKSNKLRGKSKLDRY